MVTRRSASVRIHNMTGQGILSASVSHKYSDDYKNHHTWAGPIKSFFLTDPDDGMAVDFNTGAFTTGRDWWFVTWVTEDGVTHVTDPSNARGFIDVIEKIGKKAAIPATSLAIKLAAAPEPAISKAAAAAVGVTSALVLAMTNDEKTAGFKQHILRSEDASGVNVITLTPDAVVFTSPSGASTTQVSQ